MLWVCTDSQHQIKQTSQTLINLGMRKSNSILELRSVYNWDKPAEGFPSRADTISRRAATAGASLGSELPKNKTIYNPILQHKDLIVAVRDSLLGQFLKDRVWQ